MKLIQTYRESDNLVEYLKRLVGTVADVENFREVGSANNPAFQNSWVNYDLGWDTAAFYKDPYNVVHLKGLVKSGTINTAIFTLPQGYRPASTLIFPVIAGGNTIGRVDILANGDVQHLIGNNAFFSLNLSFRSV